MSYRHRLSGQAAGPPIMDDAPSTLRVGFSQIFFAFNERFRQMYPGDLLEKVETTIRRRYGGWRYSDHNRTLDELIVEKCDWLEFYRIVELVAELSTYQGANNYREIVNALLEDENMGWRLGKDDLLTHAVSADFTEATAAAIVATDRPELRHLRDQLASAIDRLKQRTIDPENAVKDAVGALVGVARWRLGTNKGELGDLARQLKNVLHPALAGSIDALTRIEGYRGDMAAHAAKADRAVTPEEAIFVIHQCSARQSGCSRMRTLTGGHDGSGRR